MKIYATSREDNDDNISRVEFNGTDMDVIESFLPRLRAFAEFERAFALSWTDQGITSQFAELIETLYKGWDAEEDVLSASSAPDVTSPFD